MTLYNRRKQSLIFMIDYYETQCIKYVQFHHLTLDELEVLWALDENMVDVYSQELVLLEAQYLIGLV